MALTRLHYSMRILLKGNINGMKMRYYRMNKSAPIDDDGSFYLHLFKLFNRLEKIWFLLQRMVRLD